MVWVGGRERRGGEPKNERRHRHNARRPPTQPHKHTLSQGAVGRFFLGRVVGGRIERASSQLFIPSSLPKRTASPPSLRRRRVARPSPESHSLARLAPASPADGAGEARAALGGGDAVVVAPRAIREGRARGGEDRVCDVWGVGKGARWGAVCAGERGKRRAAVACRFFFEFFALLSLAHPLPPNVTARGRGASHSSLWRAGPRPQPKKKGSLFPLSPAFWWNGRATTRRVAAPPSTPPPRPASRRGRSPGAPCHAAGAGPSSGGWRHGGANSEGSPLLCAAACAATTHRAAAAARHQACNATTPAPAHPAPCRGPGDGEAAGGGATTPPPTPRQAAAPRGTTRLRRRVASARERLDRRHRGGRLGP